MNTTFFKPIHYANLLLLAVATGFVGLFYPTATGWSLLAGMGLMAANFLALDRIVRWLIKGSAVHTGISIALLMLKFGLFLVSGWIALRYVNLRVLPFGVGVTAIIFLTSLTAFWAGREPVRA